MRLTIYQKPACTTCRQVHKVLQENGIDFEAVDYCIHPLSKQKLKELLRKMGIPAKGLLRTNEPIYRELGLARRKLSEDGLIDLMAKHPDLIQRPIAERGRKAVLARPSERIKKILR